MVAPIAEADTPKDWAKSGKTGMTAPNPSWLMAMITHIHSSTRRSSERPVGAGEPGVNRGLGEARQTDAALAPAMRSSRFVVISASEISRVGTGEAPRNRCPIIRHLITEYKAGSVREG